MRNSKRKQSTATMISPIYERRPSKTGKGLAGFTVQTPREPFMNHIRFFDSGNREEMLAELNELRRQILDLLDKDPKLF